MATFPALTPATRAFTPGEYPHTPFSTYNGLQNRVRHSNVMLSSSLRLSFIALAEADMLSILSHYQGQFGSFESFTLPSSIWSGVTTISDYELTDYRWRYTDPPSVDDVYCGRYNVELALETVPPEGAFVGAVELYVLYSLAGGAAAAASGLQQTITLTLDAEGFVVPGLDESITASIGAANGIIASVAFSLAAGTAGVAGNAVGLDESITLSLAGGTATGGSGGGPATDEASFWSDWAFTSSDIFLYEQGAATESPAYWMTWQALSESSPLLFEDAT
jgi:hypothetical protein